MLRASRSLRCVIDALRPAPTVDDPSDLNRVVFGRAAVAAAVAKLSPEVLRHAKLYVGMLRLQDQPEYRPIAEAFAAKRDKDSVRVVDESLAQGGRSTLDEKVAMLYRTGHVKVAGTLADMHEGLVLDLQMPLHLYNTLVPAVDDPSKPAPIYLAVDAAGAKPKDIGAVVQTAAAYNLDGVMISGAKPAWRYPVGPIAWASAGACFGVPLYDIGSAVEFVEDTRDEFRWVGVYNATNNRRAMSLAEFAARGPVEGDAPEDNRPWVLLTGMRPNQRVMPTAIRLRQELLPMCATTVKLNPRNGSFFPMTAAAAMMVDAAHSAREVYWPGGRQRGGDTAASA